VITAQLAHEHGSNDMIFVVISVIFALVGSFAALLSAAHIPSSQGTARLRWVAVSAVSLGGGAIWAMHFTGMVGYHVDSREIVYDVPLTALSLLIALVASGIGLAVVGANPRNKARLVLSGLLTGLGIAAMHYTGMAAMRAGSKVSYDPKLVEASIAIAVLAALAALWIVFRVRTFTHLFAASVVMAAAVCGMHYTAMAATRVAVTSTPSQDFGADPISLTFLVCVITFTVLILVIFTSFNTLSSPRSAEPDRGRYDGDGRRTAPTGRVSGRHTGTSSRDVVVGRE
jgi:NO-binding membrane sensor protein with MHYT domain